MLREHDVMKKEMKNLKTSTAHERFYFICKIMISNCIKCRKTIDSNKPKVAKTNKGKLCVKSKKSEVYQRTRS